MKNEVTITKENFNLSVNAEMINRAAVELQGLGNSFIDNIKLPSGGGLAFEVPGDDSENPDIMKELTGVIIAHHPMFGFWEGEYDGDNTPPICYSMDSIQGIDIAGEVHDCQSCPKNQYGSNGKGKGKACKNAHRIYFLMENSCFPAIVDLPPTSLGNFGIYLRRNMIQKQVQCYEVVTQISLTKKANNDGIIYSQALFKNLGKLPSKQQLVIKQYVESFKASSLNTNTTTTAQGFDIQDSDYTAERA